MLARLLPALALLAPVPAAAQASAAPPAPAPAQVPFAVQMLVGSWALRVDGTVMFRFDIARDANGWSGSWTRPRAFVTDGATFASLAGPPVEQKAASGRAIGDWAELNFVDQRPGALPDTFRFHLVAPDRVELIYADTGLAPFVLERIDPGTALGPWAEDKVYRLPGVTAGPPVRFTDASAVPPSITPRHLPSETDRPPPVEGR